MSSYALDVLTIQKFWWLNDVENYNLVALIGSLSSSCITNIFLSKRSAPCGSDCLFIIIFIIDPVSQGATSGCDGRTPLTVSIRIRTICAKFSFIMVHFWCQHPHKQFIDIALREHVFKFHRTVFYDVSDIFVCVLISSGITIHFVNNQSLDISIHILKVVFFFIIMSEITLLTLNTVKSSTITILLIVLRCTQCSINTSSYLRGIHPAGGCLFSIRLLMMNHWFVCLTLIRKHEAIPGSDERFRYPFVCTIDIPFVRLVLVAAMALIFVALSMAFDGV